MRHYHQAGLVSRAADITQLDSSHKNSVNKNIFKGFLKRAWICAWRIVSGSRFQAASVLTELGPQ